MAQVKTGAETTEYKVAKSAGVWGVVGIVLGTVMAAGGQVLELDGVSAIVTTIVGGVVVVAGFVQRTLVGLGYIKARSDVKTAATPAKK